MNVQRNAILAATVAGCSVSAAWATVATFDPVSDAASL